MSIFDRMVVRALPVVPKAVVGRVAQRYVAGSTLGEAVEAIRGLAGEGAMATVDVLGEEVTERDRAESAVDEYLRVLDTVRAERLAANISIKPTMLGLKIDEALAEELVGRLVRRAAELGSFVRIDMEDHTCTDATLRLYGSLRQELGSVGVVLQAMLRRTPEDIAALAPVGANVRLCKGIYREPESLAFQGYDEVREAFVRCLEQLFAAGCYVGIATHDEVLVERSLELIQRFGLKREEYEFQMLLGVTPSLRARLLGAGHRLRVYVPYGADWYAYSMRRLRENPTVARHIMKAFFSRG
ncbi:MAG: proline dehydrogenase family protein [Deltaproteobacteria bacterium]|nr:proline dehydrogenase family protein [Deltaproteobacteria bacterium]